MERIVNVESWMVDSSLGLHLLSFLHIQADPNLPLLAIHEELKWTLVRKILDKKEKGT